MIPIHDDNPTSIRPVVTIALVVLCVLVFLWQLGLTPRGMQQMVYALGVIPAVLFGEASLPPEVAVIPAPLTILTSMFLHGGLLHLGGNMVYVACDERTGCDEQQIVVRAVGDSVEATVDGEPVELTTERRIGHIGIGFHRYHSQGRGQELTIKEVKLRPLQLTPLFDGETLDGWNILPGRNSEFTVEEGAIRIVNGNGQIETEGVYQDFLLQLDVYSNGDALNSGVFFRGPVGEFWRGYESQVRNEWRGDDRTLPVDYGTGGLYGLDPARKVVSSDFEWFNKTIVANGNHFAVWVNGYQVADYVDTRPVHPQSDAKNGFVPHAGTIHLQGHDPLTDLSFKDIHIQEYPDN